MLGIGGSLQTPSQHRPPADKHKKNVQKLLNVDPYEKIGGDSNDRDPSSKDSKSKKRKRDEKESVSKKEPKKQNSGFRPLADVIKEGKTTLQGPKSNNGVTFAFMGSSGCGKSTVIRKVFIDQIFGKNAPREDGKEFIITVFTESAKSDAFKDLDKTVIVDGKGIDEHTINWCYHMNEEYDKKYNFFLILDDVLDINYKMLVKRMFLTMRNTNISSLISLQYPNLIPKSIRTSVYFSLCFNFNNLEGVEVIVRGWLAAYMQGRNIREKVDDYLEWTRGADGHRMFLLDNLNHRVYRVDENYMCEEIFPLPASTERIYKFGKDPEEDKIDASYI